MLSAFILGLSLGAFWIRRRMETMTRPLAVLVNIQMVMGGFALLSLAFYQQSFQWTATILAAVGRTDQGYTLYTLARYALCLVIAAGHLLRRHDPLHHRTLFVSGAGESATSWSLRVDHRAAAPDLLIPLLGLKGTLILGGVMDMAVGLLIVWLLSTRGAGTQTGDLEPRAGRWSDPRGRVWRASGPGAADQWCFSHRQVWDSRRPAVLQGRENRDGSVTMPKSGRLSIGTNGKLTAPRPGLVQGVSQATRSKPSQETIRPRYSLPS